MHGVNLFRRVNFTFVSAMFCIFVVAVLYSFLNLISDAYAGLDPINDFCVRFDHQCKS